MKDISFNSFTLDLHRDLLDANPMLAVVFEARLVSEDLSAVIAPPRAVL